MSATATLLTLEEFRQLPQREGVRLELSEGVVTEMPGGGPDHEITKANIIGPLAAWSEQTGRGRVFAESLFSLSPSDAYIPDVAWLSAERLARGPRNPLEDAPDLVVEVVSSETAAQLEKKVEAYLRHGSRAVSVAYPEQRAVRVFRRDGSSQLLQGEQALEDREMLPGFQVSVSRIFEGLLAS